MAHPHYATHDRDLRGVGRPHEPQARAGALQPDAGRLAAGRHPDHRLLAHPDDRRAVANKPPGVDGEVRRRAPLDDATWQTFAAGIHYQPGDIGKPDDFARLEARLRQLEGAAGANRVYYLATAPQFYEPVVSALGAHGMAAQTDGARRIVVEKPFGTDLATAQSLNAHIHTVFRESQVFRIDHYLGKESVQNILALRFREHHLRAGLEPPLHRPRADHGRRGGEGGPSRGLLRFAGVLRDMFQNHLLQLLMVTAMEAPARFNASAVRNEKVKVLEAIRPLDAGEVAAAGVRGRYRGYLDEPAWRRAAHTATFGRSASRSTTGGGRECPSTCGAARR